MKTVYILFKHSEDRSQSPFIMGVYETQEAAECRRQELFSPENYFIEEWEVK